MGSLRSRKLCSGSLRPWTACKVHCSSITPEVRRRSPPLIDRFLYAAFKEIALLVSTNDGIEPGRHRNVNEALSTTLSGRDPALDSLPLKTVPLLQKVEEILGEIFGEILQRLFLPYGSLYR